MNESVSGVLLGIVGALGLTYIAVKVRQNQRRLQRIVGVINSEHTFETAYLFRLADSGQLELYSDLTPASFPAH